MEDPVQHSSPDGGSVHLVRRHHVDLLRTASATCRA
ncbi:MAG: putative leader peptide [Kineosporiaceae bacterium]